MLLLAVGARRLPPDEMIRFVSQWVVINTTVTGLSAAFDQLGPRVVARHPDLTKSLRTHATAVPAFGGAIALVIMSTRYDGVSVVASIGYVLAISLWTGERSIQLATGRFGGLAVGATVALGASIVSLAASTFVGGLSVADLFVSAAIGSMAGWISLRATQPRLTEGQAFRQLPRAEYRLAVSVALSAGSALMVSSGGLVLATAWGVDDAKAVAYAGIVNLVRVPFMIMNSTSGPINVELARRSVGGDGIGALRLAAKWAGLMIVSSAALAVAVALAGELALRVFIGESYVFDPLLALVVVAVESALWLAGVGRFLGIALGRSGLVALQWMLGGVVFAALALVDGLGAGRLIWAPLLGAGTVALLAMAWMVLLGSKGRITDP